MASSRLVLPTPFAPTSTETPAGRSTAIVGWFLKSMSSTRSTRMPSRPHVHLWPAGGRTEPGAQPGRRPDLGGIRGGASSPPNEPRTAWSTAALAWTPHRHEEIQKSLSVVAVDQGWLEPVADLDDHLVVLDRTHPVAEVHGVEGDREALALVLCVDGGRTPADVLEAAIDLEPLTLEGQPHRVVVLPVRGDLLERVQEGLPVDGDHALVAGRDEAAELGNLALDQPRREPPPTAGEGHLVGLDADLDGWLAGQRPGGLRERSCGDQRGHGGVLPAPVELADGEPVGVGRREGQVLGPSLEQHGGQHRPGLVVGGGAPDLGGCAGQRLAGERADVLEGRLGDRREVLRVEQPQLVGDLAASHLEPSSAGLDLDQAGREVADHVAEDAAGDDDAPVRLAAHLDDRLAGVLQIGRDEAEPLPLELEEGPAEDRQGGPGGDRSADPRHRVGEVVALSRELQDSRPPELSPGTW